MKIIEFYALILGLKLIRMIIFGFEKEINKTLRETITTSILEIIIAIFAYYILEPIIPKLINFLR